MNWNCHCRSQAWEEFSEVHGEAHFLKHTKHKLVICCNNKLVLYFAGTILLPDKTSSQTVVILQLQLDCVKTAREKDLGQAKWTERANEMWQLEKKTNSSIALRMATNIKKKTVVSRQHFFHSVSLMGDKTEGWKETLNVMRILIFTSLWQYFENIFKQCSSSTAANALIKLNTNWCATSYLRIHKFQWRPGPAWSPAPFLLNLPIGSNQQGYNFSEEQNIRNQSSTGHSCKY